MVLLTNYNLSYIFGLRNMAEVLQHVNIKIISFLFEVFVLFKLGKQQLLSSTQQLQNKKIGS